MMAAIIPVLLGEPEATFEREPLVHTLFPVALRSLLLVPWGWGASLCPVAAVERSVVNSFGKVRVGDVLLRIQVGHPSV
jgi:hypothetical protein